MIYLPFFIALLLYNFGLATTSPNALVDPLTSVFVSTPFGKSDLTSTASCACRQLFSLYPETLFFPNSTNYTTENLAAWDERSNLDPACIFIPHSANQVAKGVSILNLCNAQFAVRGGGHMNVGHNNGCITDSL